MYTDRCWGYWSSSELPRWLQISGGIADDPSGFLTSDIKWNASLGVSRANFALLTPCHTLSAKFKRIRRNFLLQAEKLHNFFAVRPLRWAHSLSAKEISQFFQYLRKGRQKVSDSVVNISAAVPLDNTTINDVEIHGLLLTTSLSLVPDYKYVLDSWLIWSIIVPFCSSAAWRSHLAAERNLKETGKRTGWWRKSTRNWGEWSLLRWWYFSSSSFWSSCGSPGNQASYLAGQRCSSIRMV